MLDWTAESTAHFVAQKAAKTRVGTMDLKIASIALANDAMLPSRNLQDYQKVPGATRRRLAGVIRRSCDVEGDRQPCNLRDILKRRAERVESGVCSSRRREPYQACS